MKRSTLVSSILLLSVLAISLSAVGLTTAEADQTTPGQTVRRISIDSGGPTVFVRSDLKQGNVENHFGLLFNSAHGIVIRVAFNQAQEETDSENETHFNMVVGYINLIEYNDTNGNGGFDLSVDHVYQRVPLWNWTYSMPELSNVTSSDGKQGYRIESHTTNAPFTFTVVADIFPQYAREGNTVVQPTETKITTEIANFHFLQSKSRLSLQVIAVSQTNVESENSQLEQSVRVRSATANGYFKIDPSATVDNRSVQAVTTVNTFRPAAAACLMLRRPVNVENCLEKVNRGPGPVAVISISFPQGNKIIHDPLLGIEMASPTPITTTTLLAGTALAAIAIFGLLVYAGRRSLASKAYHPGQGTAI